MAMRRRFVDSKKGYKIKELPSKISGKFGDYDEYKIEVTGLPFDAVFAFKNILKNSILKNCLQRQKSANKLFARIEKRKKIVCKLTLCNINQG